MATWYREVDLESWGDLGQFIRDALSPGGIAGAPVRHLWFRGQGDANWPLVASFDRLFSGLSSRNKADVYDSMIATFRDRAINQSGVSGLSHEELICLMQHYGAPTRVLDWTTSPYIAAYFAFASEASLGDTDDRQRAAVYVLNASDEIFKGFHTLKLIRSAPLDNLRSAAQRGRFTLNLSSHADLLSELRLIHSNTVEDPPEWIVHKLTVPRADASLALRDLELMGITSETLFLGLEGTAKYAFFHAMDEAGLLDHQ